jgi:hypothetical protein
VQEIVETPLADGKILSGILPVNEQSLFGWHNGFADRLFLPACMGRTTSTGSEVTLLVFNLTPPMSLMIVGETSKHARVVGAARH